MVIDNKTMPKSKWRPCPLETIENNRFGKSAASLLRQWFARESYALRLDIDSISCIQVKNKRILHIVKLHRTMYRLLQVAASRPVCVFSSQKYTLS